MIWMDSLIIDIEILLYLAAFPEAKDSAMVIISSSVVGLKRLILEMIHIENLYVKKGEAVFSLRGSDQY